MQFTGRVLKTFDQMCVRERASERDNTHARARARTHTHTHTATKRGIIVHADDRQVEVEAMREMLYSMLIYILHNTTAYLTQPTHEPHATHQPA